MGKEQGLVNAKRRGLSSSDGAWSVLLQWAGLGVMILAIGLFFAGIPYKFHEIQTPCSPVSPTQCDGSLLTPSQAQGLQSIGITTTLWAAFELTLNTITALAAASIAVLILFRLRGNWFAILLAFALVTFDTDSTTIALARAHPIWAPLVTWFSRFGSAVFPIIFYLFPDGLFVPRWTRFLVIPWLLAGLSGILFYIPDTRVDNIFMGLWIVVAIGSIVALIYRYLRVSTPVQRQQIKWLILFLTLGILILTPVNLILEQLVPLNDSAPLLVFTLILNKIDAIIIDIGMPLALGLAIFRYHLWDVDRLINRTLVYSILTGTLAVLFFCTVIILQALLRLFTGQDHSQFVTVISTLAIVALFSPLRHQIQKNIDRHFYRRKYSAEKTLEAFQAKQRDEVDLDRLAELVEIVVNETIQPAHVSLWIQTSPSTSGSPRLSAAPPVPSPSENGQRAH